MEYLVKKKKKEKRYDLQGVGDDWTNVVVELSVSFLKLL